MAIRGVVFDFNGTLFWDTPLHRTAWEAFCRRHGLDIGIDELSRRFHGQTNADIMPALFERDFTDEEVCQLADEKELMYQEICRHTDMAFAPGAERLLNRLKEQGIPFTIATGSERLNVDFYYEHFHLERWFPFEKIVYADGTFPGKPDPEMYLRAMRILGTRPEETLIFEDSNSGIQAAVNAHAGRIVIVDSIHDDYSRWDFQQIRSFDEIEFPL